ncbi:hypothetical protein B4O97_05740 [Marispirochaeta aestuarii]|uniref:Uncharacterized protein n=1 Tax=Marispirochaeta aestuarii TaxID=1963862 RepID=A0A1Y1S0C7_9SPIO|nr:hypothetical protein B4O97_05740 [Marispirochaeta aestuarii]
MISAILKKAVVPVLLLLACMQLSAQEDSAPEPLPRGFDTLELGMSMADIKNELLSSDDFLYRGDPDVSLLERENLSLMEVEGFGFFASAQFQFSQDDRLYAMLLVMDPENIDYYSVYSTLTEKYGNPADLSPQRAYWENENVRISLERPVMLRYIDRALFDAIRQEGETLESYERISREEFLSRF